MSARSAALRIAVVAGLIAAAVWLVWRLEGPRTVTAVLPVHGPAVQAVYATGTVEAGITIRIATQLGGRIAELKADEGDSVKTGDVLLRLDDSDMRASVAELEARAQYAGQQFQRVDELVKRGWSTRDKLDLARAERDATRNAARRIRDQAAFMTLKAPADGQIIRRDGEVGDYVPINQPVFYMAKAGVPPRITADVDEEDVPLVKTGQKVLIRADAFPDKVFEGEVAEITPKGDPVARSYRVRVTLPAGSALHIGMTAETNIVTREKPDALLVPTTALTTSGEAGAPARSTTGALWIVRDGRAVRQTVEVGIKGRERTEITGGLEGSAPVVVNPPHGLEPGERVRTKMAAPQGPATDAKAGTRP